MLCMNNSSVNTGNTFLSALIWCQDLRFSIWFQRLDSSCFNSTLWLKSNVEGTQTSHLIQSNLSIRYSVPNLTLTWLNWRHYQSWFYKTNWESTYIRTSLLGIFRSLELCNQQKYSILIRVMSDYRNHSKPTVYYWLYWHTCTHNSRHFIVHVLLIN